MLAGRRLRGDRGGGVDVFDQTGAGVILNNVGVVGRLVVFDLVALWVVFEVTTAAVFLPVDRQVIQRGHQHGAVRYGRRGHGSRTRPALLAADAVGGDLFAVRLLFSRKRDIVLRQAVTVIDGDQL